MVQGGPFILEGNEVRIVNKTDMLTEAAVADASEQGAQSTQVIK